MIQLESKLTHLLINQPWPLSITMKKVYRCLILPGKNGIDSRIYIFKFVEFISGFYMTELFANVTLANCLWILHGRFFCGFLAKESFIVQGKNGIDSRILTIVEIVEFPSRIICRLLWEGSLILPGKNEIEGQIYTFRAIEFPFKRFFAIFFC